MANSIREVMNKKTKSLIIDDYVTAIAAVEDKDAVIDKLTVQNRILSEKVEELTKLATNSNKTTSPDQQLLLQQKDMFIEQVSTQLSRRQSELEYRINIDAYSDEILAQILAFRKYIHDMLKKIETSEQGVK